MKYAFKGVVSDRNGSIKKWVEKLLPGIPHQFCCAHFMREVDSKIKYGYICKRLRGAKTKQSYEYFKNYYKPEILFHKKIYNILFAKTERLARKRLNTLIRQRDKFPDSCQPFIVSLAKDASYFFRHFKVRGLPKTNNFTELKINQIENRNKLIEGFQSDETAENFIRLLIHYLNLKKFTYAKKKHNFRNGKVPLELAKSNLKIKDWLKFSQK
jgi:transposase-like protein